MPGPSFYAIPSLRTMLLAAALAMTCWYTFRRHERPELAQRPSFQPVAAQQGPLRLQPPRWRELLEPPGPFTNGASFSDVTPRVRALLGGAGGAGVLVNHVRNGSPADQAGLKTDDLIVAIDGTTVMDFESMHYLALHGRGVYSLIEIIRDRRLAILKVRQPPPHGGPVDI